jgi:hypothetical protein
MNDDEIMNIMEKHSGWRYLLTTDPRAFFDKTGEFKFENRGNASDYLMVREDFLRRLRQIVPENADIINARQAAEVEKLRHEYEAAPNGKRKLVYSQVTVRGQTKSGKLKRLTHDEQVELLGGVQSVSFYRFKDVLELPIGRWPFDARIIAKNPIEKKKRGRPSRTVAKA